MAGSHRFFIGLFLAIHFSHFLSAQVATDTIHLNRLQLELGVGQIKEENLHGKVHQGILAGVVYRRSFRGTNISDLTTGLRLAPLKTSLEESIGTANGQLWVKYSYWLSMSGLRGAEWVVGPVSQLTYNVSYYSNWDESHLYWSNHLAFGVGSRIKRPVADHHSLTLGLDLLFVSVFSRPEEDRQYKIDDTSFTGIVRSLHSNPELGTVNEALAVDVELEYRFRGGKSGKSVQYAFGYTRFDGRESQAVQSDLHRLGFSFYFK